MLVTEILPDPASPRTKLMPLAKVRSPKVIAPEPDPMVSELVMLVALPVPRLTLPVELILPESVLVPVPVIVTAANGTPV